MRTADQVGKIELILFERESLLGGDGQFGTGQRLRGTDRIHALELKDRLIIMIPDRFQLIGNIADVNAAQRREPFPVVGQGKPGQLTFVPPDTCQPADENAVYSRISSVNRRLSFIPAAPSRVRIDLAVRPAYRSPYRDHSGRPAAPKL